MTSMNGSRPDPGAPITHSEFIGKLMIERHEAALAEHGKKPETAREQSFYWRLLVATRRLVEASKTYSN